MQLTKFGQFIRKYRINNLILLKHMADCLGVSSAFLSAVETGKKNLPPDFEKKLLEKYTFSKEEKQELLTSIDNSKTQEIIQMPEDSFNKELVGAFCRNFETLDLATKEKILGLLTSRKE
ncbi:helix-turn-helix domain-containing protein [Pelistega suis]|uniref:Helix-turn-helix transcriptional regulator n=1 Tax=Pelistega suis TaxID=1631957 RepID=A0A849P7P0_9BURK|nr:helix-turn-helix transcriptional regulator [Pelistega suis]NOL51802.1 helix-turn-helix transcriptional regulator [Pelistega suis]